MIGKKKKLTAVPTSAPVEQTQAAVLPEEVTEVKVVQEPSPVAPIPTEQPKVVQVPVYLSQDQVNNLVIENHLMLKEILAIAQEE